jgi:hypothetical protein
MKNIKKILALLLMLFAFSCEKYTYELTEATKEYLVAGSDFKKWQLIDPGKVKPNTLPNDYTIILPCVGSELPNGSGYFYRIYLDGKIELEDGCGTKQFIIGAWSFTSDKSKIQVTFPDFTATWDIMELSVSRLVFKIGNDLYTFAPTPG